MDRIRIATCLIAALSVATLAAGCGGRTPEPTPAPAITPAASPTVVQHPTPTPTPAPSPAAGSPTPAGTPEPTALPSDLRITWGDWWYEGEYLANPEKYPADPAYHDRSFNIRVTIQNTSSQILPGDVLPVFYLTDGEGERPVITWYYSTDDLRPLKPGEKKEAVFRALTHAPDQWIARAEIHWRGQVWAKEFPKR
ncbi:MAG: hypothetical protein QHH80_13840 [Anaerolineae bacterium]|nr:hypothetical protein [Anaerolineae bacterium]